jgi:hypothetical protein
MRKCILLFVPFSVPLVVGCRQWHLFQRGNNQHAIMTRFFLALLSLLLSAGAIAAYSTPPSTTTINKNALGSRRDWMNGLVAGAATGAVALLSDPQPAKAVISSKYCAYGTGDGCEDLAEGNEYIRQLQAKSAVNKESIILVRSCLYRVVPVFLLALPHCFLTILLATKLFSIGGTKCLLYEELSRFFCYSR